MTLKRKLLIWIIALIIIAVGLIAIASFLELDKGFKNLYNLWNTEPTPAKLAEDRGISKEVKEVSPIVDTEVAIIDYTPAFSLLENQRITAYTIRPEEGTNCESASGFDLCKYRHRDEPFFVVVNKKLKLAEIIACPPEYNFETIISFLEVNYEGMIYERYFKCLDRMNKHHREMGHWDIFMGQGEEALQEARAFGIKYRDIKVYK